MFVQAILILITGIIFFIPNDYLIFISIICGGIISMVNNYLIKRFSNRLIQGIVLRSNKGKKTSKTNIVFSLSYSVIIRIIIVSIMILIGFKIGLSPTNLLIGFIVAQFGLFIDKIRNIG